jgi:hypothetical protein
MGLFVDRTRRDRRHLEWKVRLFAAGAVLGLAGIYLEERWLTGGGIAVLLAGVLLRFVPGWEERSGDGEGGEGGGLP